MAAAGTSTNSAGGLLNEKHSHAAGRARGWIPSQRRRSIISPIVI
jgi:hypothetical protein